MGFQVKSNKKKVKKIFSSEEERGPPTVGNYTKYIK